MRDTKLRKITVVIITFLKCTDEIEIPIKNPKAIPMIAVTRIRVLSFALLNVLKKRDCKLNSEILVEQIQNI